MQIIVIIKHKTIGELYVKELTPELSEAIHCIVERSPRGYSITDELKERFEDSMHEVINWCCDERPTFMIQDLIKMYNNK